MSAAEIPVDRAALLLVELQNDIVHADQIGTKGFRGKLADAVQKRDLLGRVSELAAAARAARVPVGYVNFARKPDFPRPRTLLHRRTGGRPTLIEGTSGAEIHPRVAAQPGDFVFTRCTGIDGSYGTQLYPVMRALGRDVLIVCGVSTTLAVEGLVRGSVNRGFEMFVVADCCAGFPEEWHDFSIRNILPLLATVTTSDEVRRRLEQG